jgi:hypothetical protein
MCGGFRQSAGRRLSLRVDDTFNTTLNSISQVSSSNPLGSSLPLEQRRAMALAGQGHPISAVTIRLAHSNVYDKIKHIRRD